MNKIATSIIFIIAFCINNTLSAQRKTQLTLRLSIANVNYRIEDKLSPSSLVSRLGSTEVKLGIEYSLNINTKLTARAGLTGVFRLPTGSFNAQKVTTLIEFPIHLSYPLTRNLFVHGGINLRYQISDYHGQNFSWLPIIKRGSNVGIMGMISYWPFNRSGFSLEYIYLPQKINYQLYAYNISANSLSLSYNLRPWM